MQSLEVKPVALVTQRKAYHVPRHPAPLDLFLDGNEGLAPPLALYDSLSKAGIGAAARYPDASALESLLAERWKLPTSQVLVTAGGDDAIDRISRAVLADGREMIFPYPSFEMMARYGEVAGGRIVRVEWTPGQPYPVEDVLAKVGPQTGIIAVISPNNPTGTITPVEVVHQLAKAAPHAMILFDLAYVEFADEDPTIAALQSPNVIVTRTLSKAWGLAGLRVGYAVAHPDVIRWMRIVGEPYAVAGTSLVLAAQRLRDANEVVEEFIQKVRSQRSDLEALMPTLGGSVVPSQANFAFVRVDDAVWLRDALAGLGISVRHFPDNPLLEGFLRITCPGQDETMARLTHAIQTALAPEALILDMDGVMVDVSQSYRAAIVQTAAHFGVSITGADIASAKAEGNANNDWVLTQRLLKRHGKEVPLEEVTAQFEALYQGTDTQPGLHLKEELLISPDWLRKLRARWPLGIVTGRPRRDAERLLKHFEIFDLFDGIVCMEDAPLKPNPAPVRLALQKLGVTRAWMFGDTPDDVRAARGASVLPIGVVAPTEEVERATQTLTQTGAARVLERLSQLDQILAILPSTPTSGAAK